ncbi:hypothetical protein SAMN05892883_2106 [Jatrophihabitans sp. GAS493]|uniref:hypothetical protein n=1 Tax=Jatrophihabitans sp. GAS493 TaxID=1907575 RepID=UPI000BB833D3|nr:hypothetical protein [Jatrophihabitans sp. GAS493]SOD72764.1 hypothetical protein SAMN05892883_2106 [Jatrophihabitans sp. GAS493]
MSTSWKIAPRFKVGANLRTNADLRGVIVDARKPVRHERVTVYTVEWANERKTRHSGWEIQQMCSRFLTLESGE